MKEKNPPMPGMHLILSGLVKKFTITINVSRSVNAMTMQEMLTVVVDKNIRGNLVGLLKRQFPKDTANVEDWAQRALIRAFKHCEAFYDADGVTGYIREAAMGIALNDKERAIERRRTLRGIPRHKQSPDPMRHIDYKVDLERAIRAVTTVKPLQAALWAIHFDKETWEDTLKDMPKDRSLNAWEHMLRSVTKTLRTEMLRKGYNGKR